MTAIQNTFEGYTDGAAISTTGAAGGDTNFNATGSIPSGGFRTCVTEAAAIGTKSYKFGCGATAGTPFLNWSSAWPDGTNNYARFYYRISAAPSATTRFCKWIRSSGNSAELSLTTGRQIRILDISAATKATAATALAANTWYRIEWFVNNIASTGTSELRIYNWDESTALSTTNVTGASFTGPATEFQMGINASTTNTGNMYVDALALSDVDWIGPVAGTLNDPPTLSLGGSSSVAYGSAATITTTANDPQGGSLTYAWTLDSKPSGSSNNVNSNTSSSLNFTPDRAGTYVVRCTVTKVTGGKTATTTRTLTVSSGVSVMVSGAPVIANVGVMVGGVLVPATISVHP